MYVESISLLNYRNFKYLDIELSPNINIFYGKNAQGKTNLLEAIYLCGTGRSHRTHYDKELIQFSQNESHIQSFINVNGSKDRIDIHLKNNSKKGIAINSLPIKKIGELFGILLLVIFSPEDLSLIKAGPSERRRFMDMEICQINKIYYFELQRYYKVLKQRNTLLKKVQKDKKIIHTIDIWNQQLINHGKKIIKYRSEFIDKLNPIANSLHEKITNKEENLRILYKPNLTIENYEKKLLNSIDRDIFSGTTNLGIHKDDIIFYVNDMDVKIYGSQGQQRTVSLSIKLAEIDLIVQEKNETPVLLLDDVLSELDKYRQKFLLESIKHIQTIITCTGIENNFEKVAKQAKIFNVQNGFISFRNDDYVL